ncbi:ureidoglycolate lyase [Ignavibacteria bacterium 4148-Me]|uniref:ureidoglycolate lyase n=1 Tax=Rosettibacter primus TaxID=3111523 RepID=UPI00336BD9A0
MKIIKINQENFKEYGTHITLPQNKPTSEGSSYKFWSNIGNYYINGKTEIGICTVYKQSKNIIDSVERHKTTPEILIPIDGSFIIPLFKEDENEKSLKAFCIDVGEAVIIKEGIWHAACLPINKEKLSYFVIFKINTPYEDVEHRKINPVKIII